MIRQAFFVGQIFHLHNLKPANCKLEKAFSVRCISFTTIIYIRNSKLTLNEQRNIRYSHTLQKNGKPSHRFLAAKRY